jgi:hypothetical protein
MDGNGDVKEVNSSRARNRADDMVVEIGRGRAGGERIGISASKKRAICLLLSFPLGE